VLVSMKVLPARAPPRRPAHGDQRVVMRQRGEDDVGMRDAGRAVVVDGQAGGPRERQAFRRRVGDRDVVSATRQVHGDGQAHLAGADQVDLHLRAALTRP
jgi:hypothetical protein